MDAEEKTAHEVRRLKSSVQDLQNALRLVSRMDAPVRPSREALASPLVEPSGDANPYSHILANNDRGVPHGIERLQDIGVAVIGLSGIGALTAEAFTRYKLLGSLVCIPPRPHPLAPALCRACPHLLFVNLAQNQIADVSPLAELQYLVSANLAENAIAAPFALPQAYLQTLTSLAVLICSGNLLANLSGLSGLTSLIILEASRNNREDLSSLSSETSKLEHLELVPESQTRYRLFAREQDLEPGGYRESVSAQLISTPAKQHEHLLSIFQTLDITHFLTWSIIFFPTRQIETLEALEKLSLLSNLSELELSGNPVIDTENYRLLLILQLPTLKKLDDVVITEDERLAAADFKQQRDEAEAAAMEGGA